MATSPEIQQKPQTASRGEWYALYQALLDQFREEVESGKVAPERQRELALILVNLEGLVRNISPYEAVYVAAAGAVQGSRQADAILASQPVLQSLDESLVTVLASELSSDLLVTEAGLGAVALPLTRILAASELDRRKQQRQKAEDDRKRKHENTKWIVGLIATTLIAIGGWIVAALK